MFLRKLTVLLVPLCMLLVLCLLIPLFWGLGWFFGSLLIGLVLGAMLGLMLPLAGATRLREPFAWLLVFPAILMMLVLLYQYLALPPVSLNLPVLRLLAVSDGSAPWIVGVEAAFVSYLLAFSIRTGRGI